MELNLDNLKAIKLLGQGATGTVLLVHNSSTNSHYALKLTPHNTHRAHQELHILTRIQSNPSPFLPSLISYSADHQNASYTTPYCSGGDLNALRQSQNDGVFSTSAIRFYMSEILSALEHLHAMGIAYRDLKPENVLIKQDGHVILTDFDLSKEVKVSDTNFTSTTYNNNGHGHGHGHACRMSACKKKSARVAPKKRSFAELRCNSFVGTDEYVAPEVVRGDGHEFAVDWWALGVLAYEMLYGRTPFKGRTRKETFGNIVRRDVVFSGGDRTGLVDLIRRLLEKDPRKRLGYVGGASEIKGHCFFKGVRWDLLTEVLRPPVIPSGELTTEEGVGVGEFLRNLRTGSSPSRSGSSSVSVEFDEF